MNQKYITSFFVWVLFLCTNLSSGQENLFLEQTAELNAVHNEEFVRIDYKNIFELAQSSRNSAEFFEIELPISGQLIQFVASENDVIGEEYKKEITNVLTFNIYAKHNKKMSGSLTLSPYGLTALLLDNGKMISVRPDKIGFVDQHIVEYGVKPDMSKYKLYCGHNHDLEGYQKKVFSPLRNNFQNGESRKTYNVAIITTGEYFMANGNNSSLVQFKVIADVNAISAIFNYELSVSLSVGNRITLYSDPNTDPFTPGDERTAQAANAIAGAYPNQNIYHIGHVFHIHVDNDGWQNGGVALLSSVCRNTTYANGFAKGGGWSGAYNNMDNGWIALAAHEFGHQFGAQHTFNGIGDSCTDAISDNNAYEIGSGTTIMSYQGICQDDNNIPSSGVLDNYFHYASLSEMFNYITVGTGNTCGTKIVSNNAIPQLEANPCGAPQITIPRNTPFYLNASGSDADGDPITYCWEQLNEDGAGTTTQGFIGSQAGNSLVAPLMRSFPPSLNSDRFFPRMDVLRTVGGTDDFEVLSSRPRTLKFVVTARDNNTNGGAINTDEININVSSSGPFVIDFPKGGEVVVVGTPTIIRWNTNNTQSSCDLVRIKLSYDDGLNYDYIIAENVSYAGGQHPFVFPTTMPSSTTARILIECMDYDCIKFYTISRSVFFISSDCQASESFVCPSTPLTADAGSPLLNLNMVAIRGKVVTSLQGNITTVSPTMRVAINNVNSTSCTTIPNVTINADSKKFRVEKTGTYTFRRSSGGSGWISIFKTASFNMANPCSMNSFVGSSATWQGPDVGNGTNVLPLSIWSVALEACTEYTMIFYSYTPLPTSVLFQEITGPGFVYELNASNSSNFTVTHVAVDINTGLVVAHHLTADFTSLPMGNYRIYTITYKVGGTSPPANVDPDDWIGLPVGEIQFSNCLRFSTNYRPIEVLSACSISSVTAGQQTPCVVATNVYTQEVVVVYDQAPLTGQLSVNGQLFDITSSPQTVTLINLDSDGLPVNVEAFFTDLVSCSKVVGELFVAPVNCCPVNIDLGGNKEVCVGTPVVLDAGNDGETYQWSKDGTALPNMTSFLNVTDSGIYSVTVTHSSGCKKSQSAIIAFVSPPVVTMPATTDICLGETLTLTPNVIGPYTDVQWFKDNVLLSGSTNLSIDITEAGSYKIEVVNNSGCKGIANIIITVLPIPVVNLGNAVVNICEGMPVTLNAGNPTLFHSWTYNGTIIVGATSSTYTVPDGQSGTYRAIVKNTADCEGFDEVMVNFFQSPTVEMESNIEVCEGDTAVIIAVASGYETFVWKKDNVEFTSSDGLVHKTVLAGLYTFEAKNLGNCVTSKSTLVEVNENPVFDLGSDIIACIGNTVNLISVAGGQSYMWTRNGSPLAAINFQIAVTMDGNYALTVTNTDNCSASDQINVQFVPGPTVNAGPDITICEGESRTITATTDGTNISWLFNGLPIPNQTTKSILASEQGTYTILVIGGPNNCEARDEFIMTVNEKPFVEIGNDRRICQGEQIDLDAGQGQGYTYVWTRDNTNAGSMRQLTASTSGIYRVTVTTDKGCSSTDQMTLTVVSLPTLIMSDSLNICGSSPKTVMPVTNGTSFSWSRNGQVLVGQTQRDLVVTMAGVYKLIVANSDNCMVEDSIIVVSRVSPTVSLGQDQSLCPNEEIILDAGLQNMYAWSTGETTKTIKVNAGSPTTTQVSTFTVTVTNSFGCTATDQINLTLLAVIDAKIIASAPGVCSGNPVTLTASGGDTYVWTDPSGTLSATNSAVVMANPTVSTVYSVEVTNESCPNDKDIDSIRVNVFQPVNVSAGQDTSVILGRTIKLNATGGTAYQWNNTSLIVGANNIRNPEISIIENTSFIVTITDINGCRYVDTVFVSLIEDPLNSLIPVSVITPNNDGDNDFLEFIGLEAFPDNSLRIYNRWGNIVFEGFKYQTQGDLFDGTRNGERLPPDTYYYVLSFEGLVYKSALTIIWD
ncbi:MAG: reprolysin-like metallopeptidase [Saprospiraceae bacterium]